MSHSKAKQQARAQQRELKHGQRDIDRELAAMERQEQQLQTQIKAAAKKNDRAVRCGWALLVLRCQVSAVDARRTAEDMLGAGRVSQSVQARFWSCSSSILF